MNLKKYFNLSFEESDKITSSVASAEALAIKIYGFNKIFLKGFVGTTIIDLFVLIFGFAIIVVIESPPPILAIMFKFFGWLPFFKVIIFGAIFWIKSRTRDRLVFDFILYISIYISSLSICFFSIVFIISGIIDKSFENGINLIFLSSLYLGVFIYSLIYSIAKLRIDGKSTSKLDKLRFFIKKISKYSGLFLIVSFLFKIVSKILFSKLDFFHEIKGFIITTVMMPIIIFLIVYIIVCYYPLYLFLPLFYLNKYRKQYEEKYGVNFKGGKK
ncbi:hypothetical protein [Xylocopilactobacillus apicola]|uniref:Beta-carotene 15,15'-monooxygenase n=1 Tax=Xylocopilactobacillus apicola TaxID=2932184 RepID=A0AAU9DQI8_9LACO|nr:hypothetical protein [Xylocopilactobacillus apicola]BDR59457.1 hypothetical protein XA3_18980 [Xylocopilactobacillus apicola]